MKTTITAFVITFFMLTNIQAQDQKLAIGKNTVEGDALVDFGDDELRGMVIAPILDAESMTSTTPGTIAFDGDTGSFRYYDGTSWSAVRPNGETGGHATGTDAYKILIGSDATSADGVVIFGKDTGETTALVLPKIENGNLKFKNPVAGLIYYDTALKAIMVYNGNEWSRF